MAAQDKLSIMEEPAFTMDEVNKEMTKVTKFAKKIFGKKKPKEKKAKVEEIIIDNDEEYDGDNAEGTKEKSDANADDNTQEEQMKFSKNEQTGGYEEELWLILENWSDEDEEDEINFETGIERDSDSVSEDGDIFADTTLENNNENGLEDEEDPEGNQEGEGNEWVWGVVTPVAAFIIILAAACEMLVSWA